MTRPLATDDLLLPGLALGPDRVALHEEGADTSYIGLQNDINHVVAQLAARGLRPGNRVAIVLPAGRFMMAMLLGALRAGALVTVLSMTLGPAARQRRLENFQPDLVITEADHLKQAAPFPTPTTAGGRLVLWTSGSTGNSRGIVLEWEGLLWNARANAATLGLQPDDRALVLLDGAYCYALVHQMLSHIAVGASVAIPRQPAWLEATGRFIDRWQPTTLAVVPSILKALLALPRLRAQLRRLRMITVGGAPIDEPLMRHAQVTMPDTQLVITYGLTEAGPRVCTRVTDANGEAQQGDVGYPLPGVEVRVAEDGELFVRSPSARVATLEDGVVMDAPPWVPTGDLGMVDATGRVRILGRKRSMINRGGAKLSPGEIEQVLETHPGVARARVVAAPHSRLGEVAKAFVLLRDGGGPSTSELAQLCLEQLGAPWVPASIEFVADTATFPRSWKEAP